VFLREARQVVEAAEHALAEVRRAAGVGDARLRLGLLNGVPPALPRRLQDLLGGPAVLISGTTSEQLRLLERGSVDLALVPAPVTAGPDEDHVPPGNCADGRLHQAAVLTHAEPTRSPLRRR
jgi:DNA-binding transcriptional LysR family regulator